MNEESLNDQLVDHEEPIESVEPEVEEKPIIEQELDEATKSSTDEVEQTVEEKLIEAESMAAEYLEGWQRARAEFANARKRLERQRAEAYSNAAIDYASQLLPILDDFERALDNVPPAIEEDSWFEGLVLVRRKLHAILDGLKVEVIEALGQPFDPNFHEALSLREADGFESGIVIEELQTGYRLGERVIRPSLVNVSA